MGGMFKSNVVAKGINPKLPISGECRPPFVVLTYISFQTNV